MQPESKLKKKFRDAFDKVFTHNAFRTPIAGGVYQKAGIPDDLFCAFDRFAWLEFKIGHNKPQKIQEHIMQVMTSAGQPVGLITGQLDGSFVLYNASRDMKTTHHVDQLKDQDFWLQVLLTGEVKICC